jgi:hypothetical protein
MPIFFLAYQPTCFVSLPFSEEMVPFINQKLKNYHLVSIVVRLSENIILSKKTFRLFKFCKIEMLSGQAEFSLAGRHTG